MAQRADRARLRGEGGTAGARRAGPDIQDLNPAGDTATAGYTPLQGQYLAFIYAYTTIHRRPPAEADMQAFFQVAPPSVHQMVLKVERLA
jgi:hypothetical protein